MQNRNGFHAAQSQDRDAFELFQAHFDQLLNPAHELIQLAATLDWDRFEVAFAGGYSPDLGAPAKATRLECAEAMLADPSLDAVVVSIVPFTPELATLPDEMLRPGSLVEQLPRILERSEKPLSVVIDAGPPYDQLARTIRRRGVPAFPACDQAIRSMGRYLCHRCPRAETPSGVRA